MTGYRDTSTRIAVPIEMLIKQADPDFYRERRHQLEYEFSNGRRFYADPSVRGSYEVGAYLTDESGTILTDESGNQIIVE